MKRVFRVAARITSRKIVAGGLHNMALAQDEYQSSLNLFALNIAQNSLFDTTDTVIKQT